MRKGESRSDLVKLPIPVSVRSTAHCEKLKPISGSREVLEKNMIFGRSKGMDVGGHIMTCFVAQMIPKTVV